MSSLSLRINCLNYFALKIGYTFSTKEVFEKKGSVLLNYGLNVKSVTWQNPFIESMFCIFSNNS